MRLVDPAISGETKERRPSQTRNLSFKRSYLENRRERHAGPNSEPVQDRRARGLRDVWQSLKIVWCDWYSTTRPMVEPIGPERRVYPNSTEADGTANGGPTGPPFVWPGRVVEDQACNPVLRPSSAVELPSSADRVKRPIAPCKVITGRWGSVDSGSYTGGCVNWAYIGNECRRLVGVAWWRSTLNWAPFRRVISPIVTGWWCRLIPSGRMGLLERKPMVHWSAVRTTVEQSHATNEGSWNEWAPKVNSTSEHSSSFGRRRKKRPTSFLSSFLVPSVPSSMLFLASSLDGGRVVELLPCQRRSLCW